MEQIFYHGSDHKIDKFSDEFAGKIDAVDAEGPGVYFTNSKENAAMWGKFTYTVSLNPRKVITNAKSANKANKADLKSLLDMNEDYSLLRVEDIEEDKWLAIEAAIRYSRTEDEVYHSIRQEQYVGAHRRFMRDMSKLGYDANRLFKKGFKFNDVDKVYHCIVYNPEIVKIIGVERNDNLGEVRKVIREVMSKVLGEDAMRLSALPKEAGLFIREINSGYDLVLYNPKEKKTYATITIILRKEENYFVTGVAAERGFGPFIYELAMMHISSEGKGLMPTRDGGIRGESWNVWKFFYEKRQDVGKKTFSVFDKDYNFNLIDDIDWENDEEKVEIYNEMEESQKYNLKIFNSAYFLKANNDYYKLKEIANTWLNNGFDKDIAIEAGDELWHDKYHQ